MPGWTRAVCKACWEKMNPARTAVSIIRDVDPVERCCLCGAKTKDGIYIRIDPRKVAFPAEEKNG